MGEVLELNTVDNIINSIYIIRGQQVMLDSDLAKIYGYEVKRLNEQVKRNIKRFPEDFMFQLTREEIDKITELVFKINEILVDYFKSIKVDLIDFKVEFGRYKGQIILADEISPDTCRFWDSETHEKLDKDRFRRDLGHVEEAYEEIYRRIGLA